MRNRSHISFRREATFRAEPHALALGSAMADRQARVSREDLGPGCFVLHDVMSPKECKSLVEAARVIGFTHAGLAVGEDVYRVNLAVRNNLRVVIDDTSLANVLWPRVRANVDARHEGAVATGLNWRFRVYEYQTGQRYFPHYDVRMQLPAGETRYSVVIFLNTDFEGGETRFFEEKAKASRRGEGRGRKFDNRVRFAARPRAGSAVVFDHELLHEGAEVTRGVKYAVRTDVIYRD
jgi:predicted 2-oxoglutarate/Fe(II)-dependent dioxygenase YbiX